MSSILENSDKYGPRSEYVPFPEHFRFKYQINVDGTVAAYRLPYLLLGNSVVFKQESKYYEHFYSLLQPGRDFVSLRSDLSDTVEKIQWARENDALMRNISMSANRVVSKALEPGNIFCYWMSVLEVIILQ